jgi:hypothetical protein
MLSRYTLELNSAVLARYGDKLKCINNIDPYLLLEFQKNTLSDETEQYPPIELEDITMYFLERKSPYTNEQIKAYKSLESYKYFKSGFVYELFVRTFDDVKLLIATVKRSYHGNTVNCWVITNLNGMVRSAHCKCEAGLAEVCSHVGAVLFAIKETQRKDKVSSIITPY